jgi:hypothetical protein
MACFHFKSADGSSDVFVRTHQKTRSCSVCGRRGATLLCDFPNPKRSSGTCDKPLCGKCAKRGPVEQDFCPKHVTEAEQPRQLSLKL